MVIDISLRRSAAILAIGALALTGCKDDKKKDGTCDPNDASPCTDGQVCEAVVDSTEMRCFDPVEVHGNVFDFDTNGGVAGATVVAIDVNGSAVSSGVVSDASGDYELQVPATRDADGNVVSFTVTLRVAASGYLPFPLAPRYAIPIAIAAPTLVDGVYVYESGTTNVGLLPVDAGGPATGTISGTVSGDGTAGALIIAVQNDVAVGSAIVNSDGTYTIFNVPLAITTLQVFRQGIAVDPIMVDLTGGGTVDGQDLEVNADTALGTVTGGLNFVDASNGAATTTVILVPAATFDEDAVRGEAPAGLRVVVPTSGANFMITGVPPGDYVILAAFENDNLVRDPDETQGGTAVLKVTVAAGATLDAGAFKITNALTLIGPGGTALETITTTTPTFRWYNDPSSDMFELYLYDAYGVEVYSNTMVPAGSGNQMVSFALPGANALIDGMTYQWRLFSVDLPAGTYISASEDLEGVFVVDTTP
jgi:hypothetical protein